MIKVTFKDGCECLYDFVKRYEKENKIAFFDLEGNCIDYNSINEIEKIEKQVKDCSIKELCEYAKEKYGKRFICIIAEEYEVKIAYENDDENIEEETLYEELCKEDYIDITSIVKGE